ncbi:hypothetical protein N7519_003049 [Penicillium mononematosum]|uniref:uncharacterized protein n=1 Tax=Penicillium mononematosum TaxID=268346 RepID=UPI002548DF02|nr:uncharacterized protein N7519_003049 [Penicillium mononematosum]KAJ6188141.1 hypothetical protein N7519_003049 [Penicillium mononematosum]
MEINTDPNFDITEFKDNPLLFAEEGIHRYCRGAFHPVSLGDEFNNGRYTVRHKLGFGESCTVWLAEDNQPSYVWHSHGPWVALKILAAHIKEPREIRNLRYLKEKTRDYPSSKGIANLLDTFLVVGPNGTHHCLVFASFGPTIELIQQSFIDFNNYGHYLEFANTKFSNSTHCDAMEASTIHRIAQKVLVAVKLMQRLEMCHGGEFVFPMNSLKSSEELRRIGNVTYMAVGISGSHIIIDYRSRLAYTSRGGFFEILGSPQAVPLERRDGMLLDPGLPKELIETAKWPGYAESISDSARLIGFGKSFLRGEEPDNLKQPVHLRCPESIIGDKVDYRLDLWHTGCFLYQLATLEPPFPIPLNDYEYIRSMIGFVEDLPTEWESKLDELRLISEQTSALERARATEEQTTDLTATCRSSNLSRFSSVIPRLKDAFVEKASDPTMARLLPIIDRLLRFRPSDRLPLHAQTTPTDSSRRGFIDDYPLEIRTQREQELPNSSERPHLEIPEVQEASERPQFEAPEDASGLPGNHEQQQLPDQDEVTNSPDEQGHQPQELSHLSQNPRQVQPEAPAGSSELLVGHEVQQAQACQSAEKDQSGTQTGTPGTPGLLSDHHEDQSASPEISKKDKLEAVDGTSDLFHNQEEPQPEASDVCQDTNKSQSEVQTGELDLSSDNHEHQPASSDISKNLGKEQLEVADGTPDLLQSQGEPQPESEIPECSKQSQLETMEDAADFLMDSRPQEPGGRKRFRSRLEGLLNHGWRPWKRRRNS